jgi:hypothetical protein
MQLRTFMSQPRMEPGFASGVMGEALGFVAQTERLDDTGRELLYREEKANLIRRVGQEKYIEMVEQVDGMFRAMPDSQIKRPLLTGPAMRSGYVLQSFYNHVNRINQHYASKPGANLARDTRMLVTMSGNCRMNATSSGVISGGSAMRSGYRRFTRNATISARNPLRE